jgi:hypothetical protein
VSAERGTNAVEQRVVQQRLLDQRHASQGRAVSHCGIWMGGDKNRRQVDVSPSQFGEQVQAVHFSQLVVDDQASAVGKVRLAQQFGAGGIASGAGAGRDRQALPVGESGAAAENHGAVNDANWGQSVDAHIRRRLRAIIVRQRKQPGFPIPALALPRSQPQGGRPGCVLRSRQIVLRLSRGDASW